MAFSPRCIQYKEVFTGAFQGHQGNDQGGMEAIAFNAFNVKFGSACNGEKTLKEVAILDVKRKTPKIICIRHCNTHGKPVGK